MAVCSRCGMVIKPGETVDRQGGPHAYCHAPRIKVLPEGGQHEIQLPDSELAKRRPPYYSTASPVMQWEIDKRLGLLDWDGSEETFVVRLWDGMDGEWIDITKPVPWADALEVWKQETAGGTVKTKYDDIDYYSIFPANTRMVYSGGNEMWRSAT